MTLLLALPWHSGLLGFLGRPVVILLVLSSIVLSGCIVSWPLAIGPDQTWPQST